MNWNFPRLVFLQINGWCNLNKLCFPNQWFSYQFFFKAIGGRGITKFKISKCWSLIKFEESLQLWVSSTYAFKELPLVVSWVIWKHINSIIFDNAHNNVIRVSSSVDGFFKEVHKHEQDNFRILLVPLFS